jgi:hypothetical protein
VDDRPEEAFKSPGEDKGVGGKQPRLLEPGAELAESGSIFTNAPGRTSRMADAAEILSDYSHREKNSCKRRSISDGSRGLIRYLNQVGMSPEAHRHVKSYIVRLVEDVRSGKETLDGIPVSVHGGDAEAEPEDVPPPAGQRRTADRIIADGPPVDHVRTGDHGPKL